MTTGIAPEVVGYELRLGHVAKENRATKARRYLIEGRLYVRSITEHETRAICSGNGAIYELGWSEAGFFCECPARGECCHLLALKLVTSPLGSRRVPDGSRVVPSLRGPRPTEQGALA